MCQVSRFMVLAGILIFSPPAVGQVRLGSDVLAAGGYRELQGKRVGLITNPSGANGRRESTIDLLRRAPGVKLVALFGPEHGVDGNVKAGELIGARTDRRTGLPVHSLYGATRKPTREMLRNLDALVYDLQDTGVRSYTYISTMGMAMEACGEAGIEFVVLDRPNPLGGERVEGPMVDDKFRSFVGRWNIPYVYGLTCGELARMINGEGWIKPPCRLTVVPMDGWRRAMVWRDTGLPWVPTSPNVPRADSPLYYAATGLFGELAGGSGATIGTRLKRPFECVIAPWLDARQMSAAMNSFGLRGVSFPTFAVDYEGQQLRGVSLKFTDASRAQLVAVNFCLLDAIRIVTGRNLYREAVLKGRDFQMFDKVCGSDAIRGQLQSGKLARDIVASWRPGEEAFRQRRQAYLLYHDAPSAPPKATSMASAPGPEATSIASAPVPKVPEAKPQPAPALTNNIPAPPAARPDVLVVTVSKGDTVSKIAKDLGVTVSDIVQANPDVDVRRLKVGQKLKISRAAQN